MRFSERTAWEQADDAFASAVQAARKSGVALLDLTVANPGQCGLVQDAAKLVRPLADARAAVYEPVPFGMVAAREAVARYCADHHADLGAVVDVVDICLTTSTSEAYSFLFRILCDAGDEVLVASPSYPLFDFIARLDGVVLREYPLRYHDGWEIDLAALEARITERTRAVIVVHPNNPTGNFVTASEARALDALCAERGLALIVDEVFLDYGLSAGGMWSFCARKAEALTFVLSGISKVCALPQMKCSWIAMRGPASDVESARERLEIVADTFLSMNAPVQFALPQWLASRGAMQKRILERMRENLAVADAVFAGSACRRLAMEGGWTMVVRVPAGDFSARALAAGVLVQPGSFYGMGAGFVVLSLLTETALWGEGLRRLVAVAG